MKIVVFTATRAEYGLLRWIIKELQRKYEVYVIAGGAHLSICYGYTIKELLEDNVQNILELPFLISSDKPYALLSSIGTGLIQVSQVLKNIEPDFVLILGDRYELFIPVLGSVLFNIPVIHLSGGEKSESSIDEQVRHAITKMSHIHMVSTQFYAENVSKMGEEDWRIHIVGAAGLENIKRLKLYSKEEISEQTRVNVDIPTVICTYHPVTLEGEESVVWQVENLLEALSRFEVQLVFTRPNAEVGSNRIVKIIKDFIIKNKNAYFFDNLGSRLYLSFLQYVKAVVGNSSSGIVEVPPFHISTVNIGNRQKGRFKPESIIQTGYLVDEIAEGLKKALYDEKFLEKIKYVENPYGDGNTSEYAVKALEEISRIPKEKILKKTLDFEVRKKQWRIYF